MREKGEYLKAVFFTSSLSTSNLDSLTFLSLSLSLSFKQTSLSPSALKKECTFERFLCNYEYLSLSLSLSSLFLSFPPFFLCVSVDFILVLQKGLSVALVCVCSLVKINCCFFQKKKCAASNSSKQICQQHNFVVQGKKVVEVAKICL